MAIIFDDEERADLRRKLDGKMTEEMIAVIGALANRCALDIALKLNDEAHRQDNVIKYHYLKGGNAISILNNAPETGDYDFQVVPTQATYEAWEKSSRVFRNNHLPFDLRNTNFAEMHRSIIQLLLDSAKIVQDVTPGLLREIENVVDINLLGDVYNFTKEEINSLIADAPSRARVAYELANGSSDDQGISYSRKQELIRKGLRALEWVKKSRDLPGGVRVDANYNGITQGLTTIGRRYLDYSESELLLALDSEVHVGGRVKLNTKTPGAITDLPYFDTGYDLYVTPSVYVNCTIPGFLLYRLALIYEYIIYDDASGDSQVIKVKSEVVDISIPRLLSAEAELSTKDEVSIVSNKGGFMIPGWRYHLFENLLLLGEIPLGISGSEHKRDKRERRVIQALSKLYTPPAGQPPLNVPYPPPPGPVPQNIAGAFVEVLFSRYIDDSRDRNLVDPAVIAAAQSSPGYFAQFSVESFYLEGESVSVLAMDDLLNTYLDIARDRFLTTATAQAAANGPLTYYQFAGLVATTVDILTNFKVVEPLLRISELLSRIFTELKKTPKTQSYVVAGALSGLIYRLLMSGLDEAEKHQRYPLKRVDIEVNQAVFVLLNALTPIELANISQAMPGHYEVVRLDADNEVALKVTIDEGVNDQGVCWLFSFSARANDDFTDLENLPATILASSPGANWYLPRLLDSRSVLQSYMKKISIIELRYPLMMAYKDLTKVASSDPTQVADILNGNYAKNQQTENDRRLAKIYDKYLTEYDVVYPHGQ